MLSTTPITLPQGTKTLEELFYDSINHACNYSNNTTIRKAWLDLALQVYNRCSDLQEKYDYSPTGKFNKRFLPKNDTCFEDEINYNAPVRKGLYFIGETHFNPVTDEKYYWVKIGRATNLKSRMSNYNTHNPMLWRIDFSEDYDKESYYHFKLQDVAIARCNHNEEWFLVDKDTYLEMCEKGFNYFN